MNREQHDSRTLRTDAVFVERLEESLSAWAETVVAGLRNAPKFVRRFRFAKDLVEEPRLRRKVADELATLWEGDPLVRDARKQSAPVPPDPDGRLVIITDAVLDQKTRDVLDLWIFDHTDVDVGP